MVTRNRQKGLSLLGVLFWGAILGGLFMIGTQVLPSVTEYREIRSAAQRAANTGHEVGEIRTSFSRSAAAGYITSIGGKDLDITKNGNGKIVVSFAYEKKISLFGPVSLVIDYAGSATAD